MSQSRRSLSVLLTVIAMAGSLQSAIAAKVILDKQGMPLCAVDDGGKGLVKFLWNEDIYLRPILAATVATDEKSLSKKVKDLCSKRMVIKMKSPEMTTPPILSKDLSYDILDLKTKAIVVKENGVSIDVDSDLRERLRQARLGGNIYRPESIRTAKLFVEKNDITSYTKELNRDLAHKYGAGFSGDVYAEVLEKNPENKKLREETLGHMKDHLNTTKESLDSELQNRFKGITFVIVKGFAHDRDNDERISPLSKVLRGFGFEMLELVTNPYGRTLENANAIADQLEKAMKEGKQLIITSGSAATTQALGAIAQLNQKYNGKIQTQFPGKVLAYLNLSGVVSGAFQPEAVTSNPLIWLAVKSKMRDLIFGTEEELQQKKEAAAKLDGLAKDAADVEIQRYERRLAYKSVKDSIGSFKDLSTKRIEKFITPLAPSLPTDVLYYNLIGVNKENGIVKDRSLNYLQTKYVRGKYTRFFKNIGANDGFIEYPGTELTPEMIKGGQIYSLVFDASHPILDGNFASYPLLNNDTNRRGIIGSVLLTLAERLKL